jgi:SAM-dependent methyltransferase
VSWDEEFASRYEEWSAHMREDVPFYVGLASEAGGPLVELAVGNGRVAIPVARATGRRVIGIDSSPAMLAQAHARAAEASVDLDLRQGDMRDLTLDEPAGLIYCPFRALLHLRTWDDRRRTFERVAASLQPDGRFAWNAFAFDHQLAARLDGRHQDDPVPHTIRYAVGDNRIDITLDDGGTSSLWWATKNEWLGLLDIAGLEVERSTAPSTESRSATKAVSMYSSRPAGERDTARTTRRHSRNSLSSSDAVVASWAGRGLGSAAADSIPDCRLVADLPALCRRRERRGLTSR